MEGKVDTMEIFTVRIVWGKNAGGVYFDAFFDGVFGKDVSRLQSSHIEHFKLPAQGGQIKVAG